MAACSSNTSGRPTQTLSTSSMIWLKLIFRLKNLEKFTLDVKDVKMKLTLCSCLLDSSRRCTRPACSHSFSKKVEKVVFQRRLDIRVCGFFCEKAI